MNQSSPQLCSEAIHVFELHRLSLLGSVITSVIHELNQPLTSMNMDASFLDMLAMHPDRLSAESVSAVGKGLLNDVLRCQKVLDHLRLLAHRHAKNEQTDINKVVENCFLLTKERIRLHGIVLSVNFLPNPVSIYINPIDLEYAFLGLILNACDSIEAKHADDKTVSKSKRDRNRAVISIRVSQDQDKIKIAIADNGLAISENVHEQQTDPIFTNLPSGKAKPNGLFLARQIIKELAGDLCILRYDDQTLGEVNLVEISLPLTQH